MNACMHVYLLCHSARRTTLFLGSIALGFHQLVVQRLVVVLVNALVASTAHLCCIACQNNGLAWLSGSSMSWWLSAVVCGLWQMCSSTNPMTGRLHGWDSAL